LREPQRGAGFLAFDGAAETVIDALTAALSDVDLRKSQANTQTQRMVTYDRSDAISGALSKAADLRVIWGGDTAVNALRQYPLPRTPVT
jgi:hypothetical protein